MREFEIKPHLQAVLRKLSKKDKTAYEAVIKKVDEIVNSPDVDHYKNLRSNMKDKKRVHVAGSFILIFSYDPASDFISFLDYDHHDNVYV
jgi:YafQ family addiction module toxin component